MEQSGIYATIQDVVALRQWTIDEGFTTNSQVASNTAQGTNRTKGIYEWSGNYQAWGATPAKMPGDVFTGEFYKAPDAAGDPDNGEIFTGTCVVNSVAITWDFTTNQVISHQVNFGGSGDLAVSAGAWVEDTGAWAEPTPCLGKVVSYNGTTESVIPHITQAVLTITREMVSSVNSGTSGGSGKCLTIRKPGAAVDWTLSLASDNGNEDALVASGVITNLRLYTTASAYWDLKWGIFEKRSGLVVNVETAEIISQTHNAAMKAFNVVSSVMTKGHIKKPDTTTWWPAA